MERGPGIVPCTASLVRVRGAGRELLCSLLPPTCTGDCVHHERLPLDDWQGDVLSGCVAAFLAWIRRARGDSPERHDRPDHIPPRLLACFGASTLVRCGELMPEHNRRRADRSCLQQQAAACQKWDPLPSANKHLSPPPVCQQTAPPPHPHPHPRTTEWRRGKPTMTREGPWAPETSWRIWVPCWMCWWATGPLQPRPEGQAHTLTRRRRRCSRYMKWRPVSQLRARSRFTLQVLSCSSSTQNERGQKAKAARRMLSMV